MTQQTKMPEPVAYMVDWPGDPANGRHFSDKEEKAGRCRPVITTDQAEAYKDACVREALEAVIQSLERESDKARHFQAYAAVLALMSQAELIRVSLSTKESKNG